MTPVEERIDHEQLRQLKEKYRDDGLERLARSNPDYYNSHGSYLPELATLLLAERAEMRDLLTEHSARETDILGELLLAREALEPEYPDPVYIGDALSAIRRAEALVALPAAEPAQPEEEPHG